MRKLRKKLKFEAPGIVPLKEDAKAAGVCEEGSHPEAHVNDPNTCFDGQVATGGLGCGTGHKNYLS